MDDDLNLKTNQLNDSTEIVDTNQDNVKVVFVPECVIQALNFSDSSLGSNVETTGNFSYSPRPGHKKPLWESRSFDDSDNVILSSSAASFDVEKILQSLQIPVNNTFSFEISRDYFKTNSNGRIPLPDGDRILQEASTSSKIPIVVGSEEPTNDSGTDYSGHFLQSSSSDNTLSQDGFAEPIDTLESRLDSTNLISVKLLKNGSDGNSTIRVPTPDTDVCNTSEFHPEGNYEIIFQVSKDFQSSAVKRSLEKDQAKFRKANVLSLMKSVLKQPKQKLVSRGTQSNRLFECNRGECTETYQSSAELQKHKAAVHNKERSFKCTFDGCKWSFTSSYKLNRHMSAHYKEKPYVCTFPGCKKGFKSSYNQRAHTRTHYTLNPDLVCPHCKKDFSAKREYTKHLREVHDEGPEFPCNICNQKFYSKQAVATHKLTHNPKKVRHICSYCQKEYSKQSELKEHVMYSHTGERPFRCDECSWAFTSMSKLRRHKLTHKERK